MAEILGLPKGMRTVPEDEAGYTAWRNKVLLYRKAIRRRIDEDLDIREKVLRLAADDCCYDMLMFGVVLEPRDMVNRQKGWYPMVPYAFQVDLVRWIHETMNVKRETYEFTLGRQDGILEKSRGMAGSYTFCAYAAWRWKYDSEFQALFVSYNADLVEKANDPSTLFYKVEAYLGLEARVPDTQTMLIDGIEEEIPLRSPEWLIPPGYVPKLHNTELALAHPTKTNNINGSSTTPRTGTGKRVTMLVFDEAAKYPNFKTIWMNTTETTDHKFALSSADVTHGTGFRDLARLADSAKRNDTGGPAFFRLLASQHPEMGEAWREGIEARHQGIAGAKEAMAREYDLDYDAGQGTKIYPYALTIEPAPLDFNPSFESLDFVIDPGIRDMCAFHLIKFNPTNARYGVLLSYANNGKGADFYASLAMATPLGDYVYGDDEERVMDFFRDHGRRIRFWLGDPAGKAFVTGAKGKLHSFYSDFQEATENLTDGRRSIAIWSSDKHEYKRLDKRHSALRWLLPMLDFNNTPDVEFTLNAVRDHHFKASDESMEVTSLAKEPVRTPGHDRVVGLEYYAAHRRMNVISDEIGIAPSVRVTASGKPFARKRSGYWRASRG